MHAQTPISILTLPKRSRTENMWSILRTSPLLIEDNYLILNAKAYRIIDSSLEHWSFNHNYASIGGNVTDREILLIHPQAGKLSELLNAFLLYISTRHLKVESNNLYSQFFAFTPKDQIERLLQHLATRVSQTLQPNSAEIQRITDQKKLLRDNCVLINEQCVPCIDFDEYLNAKLGVCRLYAVLTCLHLANLIKHNYLPAGEIKLKRFTMSNGAHAVACYINNGICWTIDPTLFYAQNTTISQAVTCTIIPLAEELTATLPLDDSFEVPDIHANENSATPSQLC